MIHDLKPEQMTPEERNQLAIDWIQDNAPNYVMRYLDQDANASHLVQAWREAQQRVEVKQ